MKKLLQLTIALMFISMISKAQTAMQFNGVDCNNNTVDLFADLDAGKAVVLFYYMPNCGSCPPPAQRIQAMANKINLTYAGKVKGYAFPFQNSTTCSYSSSWVSSNNLSAIFSPMDSGATQVAYYGGFGMPTVVLVGGMDHRVMFSTLSFSSSDTTIMRDSILALLGSTGLNNMPDGVNAFEVFPIPATDEITISIDLDNISDVYVDIADLNGKQIAIISEEKMNGVITKKHDITTYPNGNYLIRLQVNNKMITQKFTINH